MTVVIETYHMKVYGWKLEINMHVYICITSGVSIIKRGVVITLSVLIPPHFCACPQSRK